MPVLATEIRSFFYNRMESGLFMGAQDVWISAFPLALVQAGKIGEMQGMSDLGSEIALVALVVDSDPVAADILTQRMSKLEAVRSVSCARSIREAQSLMRYGDRNTIFIDPLRFDLQVASDFVFAVREALPEVVFVLYSDSAEIEARRATFYAGQRARFSHFFRLDKRTVVSAFDDEIAAVVALCQSDLSWSLSAESLRRLNDELVPNVEGGAATAQSVQDLLSRLKSFLEQRRPPEKRNGRPSVFISYRFAEAEYFGHLKQRLEGANFEVVSGASTNTFVSRAILERIRNADFFLSLMTRGERKSDGSFATGTWLLEEKGAALAFGKTIVMMVEEGVTDFGGLQGDWQRIHFDAGAFAAGALQAVEQLRSYAGAGTVAG